MRLTSTEPTRLVVNTVARRSTPTGLAGYGITVRSGWVLKLWVLDWTSRRLPQLAVRMVHGLTMTTSRLVTYRLELATSHRAARRLARLAVAPSRPVHPRAVHLRAACPVRQLLSRVAQIGNGLAKHRSGTVWFSMA